jgi:drug/metabolite transporter superfamily protein YnfA
MKTVLPLLSLAAALEIVGVAAIRHGLTRTAPLWLVLGAATLVAYGFTVNLSLIRSFGQLMGLYIAVFFVVSQLLSLVLFGERPPLSLLLGGALIVAGGVVIHLGTA